MQVNNPAVGLAAAHAATHQLGGADPLRLDQYDPTDGRPVILFPTGPGWNISRSVVTSGKGYFVRGRPARNMTIVGAGVYVSTVAPADQPWEILLWDATITNVLARTGQLSGSSGNGLNGNSLALNVANAKKAALSRTLLANTIYYAEFVCNTTPQLAKATFSLGGIAAGLLGGSLPHLPYADVASRWPEGTPPAAVSVGTSENDVPLIALWES